MTLALLNTLKNIGVVLLALAIVAFIFWLESRSERRHAEQVEEEDLQDFRDFHIAQTRDWEFPPKWHPPAKEYVAKPKERTR